MNKKLLVVAITMSLVSLSLVGFKLNQNKPENEAPQYKIITTIESVVEGGVGRSRIIENGTEIDYNQFTTERTDGKKSDQGKIKRGNAKIERFSETKILNFYSLVGLNFQNIASNDAMITSKLNELSGEGWDLIQVVSGVESDAGDGDGKGIFITRYILKRGW